MRKFRRSDQEYIDDYDRQTIEILKELEAELGDSIYSKNPFEDLPSKDKTPGWDWDISTKEYNVMSIYFRTAVRRAQEKERSILQNKLVDEHRDRLIRETSAPRNVTCDKCQANMFLETYLFKEDDTLLLFAFSCPNKHAPKKLLYPDGIRQWKIPTSKCKKCGGEFTSEKEETNNLLRFKDTCQDCGDVSIMEYDLTPDLPITEADRKKYCEMWKNTRTFEQDLEAITDFMKVYKESKRVKKEKEELNVDKVEKVNLPKLEDRLLKLSEELRFTKFKIDGHSTEKYLSVSFSLQDPTEREEKESCKVITDAIQQSLFQTNWRLMNRGVDYRLGLITGKIRAYEVEEGLLKIAKEIFEQQLKSNQ